MFKKVVLSTLCIFLLACGNNETTLPEGILSVQKMSEVQTDIQLLEALLSLDVKQAGRPPEENIYLVLNILEKHQVSKDQYLSSYDYYTNHLDSLGKIYELVMVELNKMQPKKDSSTTVQAPAADTVIEKLSAGDIFRQKMAKKKKS